MRTRAPCKGTIQWLPRPAGHFGLSRPTLNTAQRSPNALRRSWRSGFPCRGRGDNKNIRSRPDLRPPQWRQFPDWQSDEAGVPRKDKCCMPNQIEAIFKAVVQLMFSWKNLSA